MIITKLEKQKKARARWNIYVDGSFFCGLYEDTMLRFGIHVNKELTEKLLDEIRAFDEFVYGKNVAYHFLSYRIRTVSEIRKKLKEKKISEHAIARVLTLLEEQKLTNDADFASALINDRIKSKPVGKRVLAGKLFEKGVPKNISEEAIKKAFDEIDEKELALASFEKYSKRLKGKDINEQKRKTFDYLMRKGFETDIIIEIIREKIPQT